MPVEVRNGMTLPDLVEDATRFYTEAAKDIHELGQKTGPEAYTNALIVGRLLAAMQRIECRLIELRGAFALSAAGQPDPGLLPNPNADSSLPAGMMSGVIGGAPIGAGPNGG